MHVKLSYRILSLGLRVGLGIAMCSGIASAQHNPKTPTQEEMYCSGVYTDQAPSRDAYIISGEDSRFKISFHPGDLVYINQGGAQGVKVGDEFEVIRPVHDLMPNKWFQWQLKLDKAMGTRYADIGVLRVVNVQSKTSTTEIKLSCDIVQRGDIILPLKERVAPVFHEVKFDIFAPPSGKKTAMIVVAKNYTQTSGAGTIVFVNLGSAQGVQVGSYFRVFRYQGSHSESLYQLKKTAYQAYGFGSTPVAYTWDNLPRQVLGEGIVLRTGPNSSTVLLTTTREEIFSGDYVELE
jgi:hypothetical protein